MPEQDENDGAELEYETPLLADDPPPPFDGVLQALVKLADAIEGLEVDLTLVIGGQIFTGQLIGASQWFRETSQAIGGASSNSDIAASVRDLMAKTFEPADKPVSADDVWDSSPECLHLLNLSRIGAGETWGKTFPFRMRLAAVDAWSVGRAEQSDLA